MPVVCQAVVRPWGVEIHEYAHRAHTCEVRTARRRPSAPPWVHPVCARGVRGVCGRRTWPSGPRHGGAFVPGCISEFNPTTRKHTVVLDEGGGECEVCLPDHGVQLLLEADWDDDELQPLRPGATAAGTATEGEESEEGKEGNEEEEKAPPPQHAWPSHNGRFPCPKCGEVFSRKANMQRPVEHWHPPGGIPPRKHKQKPSMELYIAGCAPCKRASRLMLP